MEGPVSRALTDVIDRYSSIPFRYGEDCCQFAAACVEAVTGRNPMAELEYANRKEAYKIINGHGGLAAAMRHYLGSPSPGFSDFDVVLCKNCDDTELAGVVCNNRIVVRTPTGLADWPLSRAVLIWNI